MANRCYLTEIGHEACQHLLEPHDPAVCSNCIVHEEKGCWIWGHSYVNGYPRIQVGGRTNRKQYYVHRLALSAKALNYPGSGYHASHLCNNLRCFNPDHIVWEPQDVNESRKSCPGYLLEKFNQQCDYQLECPMIVLLAYCQHDPKCIFKA